MDMHLDRRSFLLGAGLSCVGLLGWNTPTWALPEEDLLNCRPADPLEALITGNNRFSAAWQKADLADSTNKRTQQMAALWSGHCFLPARVMAQGQAPWATVLTCADSRVAPEWIFDAAPSDLFVIRSAGNTAFDDAIASMEFGVLALKTPLIMVMGHSACGAVKAAQGDELPTPLLTELVKPIRAAIQPGQDLETATKANASYAAKQLTARSEVIKDAVDNGKLQIVVGYFDIGSGKVTMV